MFKKLISGRTGPITALSVILVLTGVALMWMGYSTFDSFRANRVLKEQTFLTESLRNVMIHLDEVLGMSAQLASYTGDEQWEQRYNKYKPLLTETLDESLKLSKQGYTNKSLERLTQAYAQRSITEEKVFALVREQRLAEAQKLLQGKDYQKQALEYRDSANAFFVTPQLEVSLERLWGEVLYLNEVVTMSVNLGAATGDSVWEERYSVFEKKLSEAIAHTTLTVSSETSETQPSHEAMQASYKKLKTHNDRIFRLIRQNKLSLAQRILQSNSYRRDQQAYSRNVMAFVQLIKTTANNNLMTEKNRTSFTLNTVIFILCLLPVGWLLVAGALNSWYLLTTEKNRQLEELNRSLDHKVEEKTKQLSEERLKLIQADKLSSIGQLAAGVAHEINNPVGYVKSNHYRIGRYLEIYHDLIEKQRALAEVITAGNLEEAQQRQQEIDDFCEQKKIQHLMDEVPKVLESSNEGLVQVQEIVQNLRSFSRIDGADEEEIDINERLELTLQVVANQLKYTCEVVKKFGEVPKVVCHPGQIQQVFTNLLINASQAIDEKGTITLETSSDDEYVTVSISDTGVGIPKEHVARIFEPFFTTKPVGSGTGLGLSICYDIIQNHNGVLEVESTPGQGTTFFIRLPHA